ncbi:MAG: extracellular solute-binding protein [Candidatus Hydrogenedentes bacterium]|nr:extracellular solute-binding protein [Candidatus Hydrogenedentota bacterium]
MLELSQSRRNCRWTTSLFCILAWFGPTVNLHAAPPTVVVYTALDEMYSRPILDGFHQQTAIEVKTVYDTEAAKTTGLVTRLLAERKRPRCDVFWNNEVAQTISLKKQGALAPYRSPAAEMIPPQFKDEEGYWTGFAARARVIIYNTNLVKNPPRTIAEFLQPQWSGKAAVSNPLFGTMATHAAALFAVWGDEKAQAFFRDLTRNHVAALSGNAVVRDLVAKGEYAVGLTDTDDANGAVEDGLPARWLFPDQGPDGLGTLLIPNSVALIKDAPHPEAAKRLIDYLLSAETEMKLAAMRSIQIPLHPGVNTPGRVPDLTKVTTMQVTFDAIAEKLPAAMTFARQEFLK